MDLDGRYTRPILLFSLVVLITPLLLFPYRFGTELARASLIYAIYELIYYMAAVWLLSRRSSLLPLAQAAGVCLIYRFALGAAFGLFIAIRYAMDVKVSLTLGMSSYLPAVLLHAAVTPFILWPLLKQMAVLRPNLAAGSPDREETESPMLEGKTTFVTTSRRNRPTPVHSPFDSARAESEFASRDEADAAQVRPGDGNGFDRATRYIGEDANVRVAAVVDHEGLMLGHFQRGGEAAEDWAPLALLFTQQNDAVLARLTNQSAERVALTLHDRKIVIAREESFYLIVVAERHNDDLLNIRFSQAIEIVKKYVSERYGHERAVNTENDYVRSAE